MTNDNDPQDAPSPSRTADPAERRERDIPRMKWKRPPRQRHHRGFENRRRAIVVNPNPTGNRLEGLLARDGADRLPALLVARTLIAADQPASELSQLAAVRCRIDPAGEVRVEHDERPARTGPGTRWTVPVPDSDGLRCDPTFWAQGFAL